MISMPQIQSIRSRRRNGESIASIARSERVSEPTVRKYLRVDDLSVRPPVRRRRGSVIDEWLPVIEGMLAEDRETWRKQRHTATRIHERLRDEYGAGVSLSTVTRTVARLRREAAAEREAGFLDLSWHPGECQADFGQVDVRYRGVVTRMRHFVLDFPYSNIGPSQLMPGENAECTCQALLNLFEWLGGVPRRIVYDNAAGVGRRRFDEIRLTRLFQAFQAHYGFEYSFCNPYSGHEKGAVEARVGPCAAGCSCRCPACGASTASTCAFPTAVSSWGTRTITGRARARPACSRMIARRCCPCPPSRSTWSRGRG